jgi:spore germination cell wall hydrolase CwlJ-like protein
MVITNRITLDVTEGATHYHATYVRPAWARTKTKTVRINRHIFYRWEKK